MHDLIRRRMRGAPASPGSPGYMVSAAALILLLIAVQAPAAERIPVHARSGLDLARAAAVIWSQDAYLVYLENDEPLDTHGAATRWSYLFHSPALKKSRVYSIRDGKILVAEDFTIKFEAPPIAGEWIDSAEAFTISDEGPARRFCFENAGKASTMLLMRGAIQENEPDRTTWLLVYNAPNLPSLFVILDARDGTVLRTWRG